MEDNIKDIIKEYQCSGCVCGSSPDDGCYESIDNDVRCEKHCAGTTIMPTMGRIFLGMPKGFNRLGYSAREKNPIKITIFETYEKLNKAWEYDMFNIPCWKHKNEKNHVFVRGLSPRISEPFLHIILEDCIDKINCLEITNNDLEEMD